VKFWSRVIPAEKAIPIEATYERLASSDALALFKSMDKISKIRKADDRLHKTPP